MANIFIKAVMGIAIIACNIFGGYSGNLPSDIEKCKSVDNENCVPKKIMEIFRRYPKGNPEFGMPNVSALPLTNVEVSKSNANSPIQLNFKFNTFTAYGLENIEVISVKNLYKDFKKPVELEIVIPNLRIKGDYESSGKLLLLPLNGKGNGDIVLKDSHAKVRVKVQLEKRDDKKTYAKIKQIKAILEPKKMIAKLDNIIMGNPTLSDTINGVINSNWQDVWAELQTGINNAMEQIIINLMSGILNELAVDDFFSD